MSWMRNLNIYKLGKIDAFALRAGIEAQRFAPCPSLSMQSAGWVPHGDDADLLHAVGGNGFLTLCTEKKVLPAAVIREAAAIRAAEVEARDGYKPGRKAMREIKEEVTDELMQRAFSIKSFCRVWFDPVGGWMVIDATSAARCDDVLRLLIKAVPDFPVTQLATNTSPASAMTAWLEHDEAPAGFTIDQDTELRATGEGRATVRFIRHTLDADEVQRHIATGKRCTRLAMTWADRISFVLTDSLELKQIEALDILKESEGDARDEVERYDADMTLMCGELAKMFADVVAALGGERVNAEP